MSVLHRCIFIQQTGRIMVLKNESQNLCFIIILLRPYFIVIYKVNVAFWPFPSLKDNRVRLKFLPLDLILSVLRFKRQKLTLPKEILTLYRQQTQMWTFAFILERENETNRCVTSVTFIKRVRCTCKLVDLSWTCWAFVGLDRRSVMECRHVYLL